MKKGRPNLNMVLFRFQGIIHAQRSDNVIHTILICIQNSHVDIIRPLVTYKYIIQLNNRCFLDILN